MKSSVTRIPNYRDWETNRERTTSLQKMLGIHKCTLLYAKGTKLANHKYCTKDDTREDGPWYIGNPEDFKKKMANKVHVMI